MSAKEFYRKSVIHIEMLPDDVLREVLRHATWVPYGIDPSDMVEKRLQSSHSKDLTKMYRASLVRLSLFGGADITLTLLSGDAAISSTSV